MNDIELILLQWQQGKDVWVLDQLKDDYKLVELLNYLCNVITRAKEYNNKIKKLKRHIMYAGRANASKRRALKRLMGKFEVAKRKSSEKVEMVITETKLLEGVKIVAIGSSVQDRIKAYEEERIILVDKINQLVSERYAKTK